MEVYKRKADATKVDSLGRPLRRLKEGLSAKEVTDLMPRASKIPSLIRGQTRFVRKSWVDLTGGPGATHLDRSVDADPLDESSPSEERRVPPSEGDVVVRASAAGSARRLSKELVGLARAVTGTAGTVPD
ncbi:uncharacterized protein A4U43_C10F16420 [Asparagus officinalis]|uniref:Uncharacterized protein n=1 Tax=Asparagus officinalis TaxID=4686 RepID=A0A5P1E357_ASPOF|nr:uncharacterized protein A4U43_C10F16420 [Asparagus officinalis]